MNDKTPCKGKEKCLREICIKNITSKDDIDGEGERVMVD